MKNNGDGVADNTTEGNKKQHDNGVTATDSKLDNNNDDDDDDDKIILTIPRVLRNCISFVCVILITIGELMNEQNLWAVLLIGGLLGIMNVIVTSLGLERMQAKAGTNFGSMINAAGTGSVVRFSDTVDTPSVREDGTHANDLEEIIRVGDKTSRKQRKRRSTTRSKRQEETGIPPDAISIDIERGESDAEHMVDSDSSALYSYSYDNCRGRRDIDRRGKSREEGTKKRPRVVECDKGRERRSKGVRERGILKERKCSDGVENRKKRVKDRDRDRDRRDRKDRPKKRKKKKKDRHEYAPCAFVQM